jgi:hypothetical protein
MVHSATITLQEYVAIIGSGFHLDIAGLVIGCSPIPLTVGAEMVIEGPGRDFVWGAATGVAQCVGAGALRSGRGLGCVSPDLGEPEIGLGG